MSDRSGPIVKSDTVPTKALCRLIFNNLSRADTPSRCQRFAVPALDFLGPDVITVSVLDQS